LSVGCALRFYFLKRWRKKIEITHIIFIFKGVRDCFAVLFWVGEVEALLQFLVCALASFDKLRTGVRIANVLTPVRWFLTSGFSNEINKYLKINSLRVVLSVI